MLKLLILLSLLYPFCISTADSSCSAVVFNQKRQKDVVRKLEELSACAASSSVDTACNEFVSTGLASIWGIKDFQRGSKVLTADEIAIDIQARKEWQQLGTADDQAVLKQAQASANCDAAVLAVMPAASPGSHGHVALVMLGNLQHSTNWGLEVPNSAGFFLSIPGTGPNGNTTREELEKAKKSYVGKPLSFAFSADDKGRVKIYV